MKQALYEWYGLNYWLFQLLNGLGGKWYDQAMLALMPMGEHEMIRVYLPAVFIFLIGRLFWRKFRGSPITVLQVRHEGAIAAILTLGCVFNGFVVGIIRIIIPMPRPWVYYYYREEPFHFAGIYPEKAEYFSSFPSEHAALVVFFLVALWPRLGPPITRYTACLLVAIVCIADIAVGMHFPADVAAGALTGAAVAYGVRHYVFRKLGLQHVPAHELQT